MGYTLKTCERLVKCADKDGHVTFAAIRKAFPDYDDDFFYGLIGDALKPDKKQAHPVALAPRNHETIMLFWENCPEDYRKGYRFKDSYYFHLSVPGSNLFYQLQKEYHQKILDWAAAVGGIIGGICALISILIS